jgi:Coenzyme PQQ synthesis protein D (PqqD)
MARTARPERVAASPAAMSQRLGDETVVLDVDRAIYYTLDDVGTVMWSVLGDAPDVTSAVDRLVARYAVERADLDADVGRFVAELLGLGLLMPLEPPAG